MRRRKAKRERERKRRDEDKDWVMRGSFWEKERKEEVLIELGLDQ